MTEWKGKSRGGFLGYRFFIFLIKNCGITAAYIFLCAVVPYFIPFAPKATNSIWLYARQILRLNIFDSISLLIRNYYRFGQILIDKVAIGNGMKDKYQFCFENYSQFLDILNSNTGTIIIGAHIGSWEMGTPFFDDYGKKINIVLYDAEYQKIKDVLKENSASADYKLIPVNTDGLSHVFAIKEALDKSEYVCFQGDRYINEERCLKNVFMGKETLFPAGPFLLASRMNVPVVFYFAMREKNRTCRFHFTTITQMPKQKNVKSEQVLLNQYTTALEDILRKYPEQWFNYYDFWKK